MDYKIAGRMEHILNNDKMCDPQRVCDLLKDDLRSVIENYLVMKNEPVIRFKRDKNKNIFFFEIEAERIKPFGYIPY